MKNTRKKIWWIIIAVVILLALVLSLPPVWSRVVYHSNEAYRNIKYWLKPPSEAVFVPSMQNDGFASSPVSATIAVLSPTPQPISEPTPIQAQSILEGASTSTSTPLPTLTPTPSPTPILLPSSVLLTGFQGEAQSMNNCGPTTLSMYLSFYDWGKDQNAVGNVVKPNRKDLNVMPYELVDFVNEHTSLRALWRFGGDWQTIKTLLNAGFPVMIEKSFEPYNLRNEGWMGHYNLVVGYDDGIQTLTVQDSYLMIHTPWGVEIPQDTWDSFNGFDFAYSELDRAWRSFNNAFIVVYPPEKENEVLSIIGPLADHEEACRIAYKRAMEETSSLTDVRDRFFAWFNAGTSLVCLQDYSTAATAFDTAFGIYPEINEASRPYRILWYQTGPYDAYYYTNRYEDVINLADQTLEHIAIPALEESYYWRALSHYALGNTSDAIDDLQSSLEYHPGYAPSTKMLEQYSKTP